MLLFFLFSYLPDKCHLSDCTGLPLSAFDSSWKRDKAFEGIYFSWIFPWKCRLFFIGSTFLSVQYQEAVVSQNQSHMWLSGRHLTQKLRTYSGNTYWCFSNFNMIGNTHDLEMGLQILSSFSSCWFVDHIFIENREYMNKFNLLEWLHKAMITTKTKVIIFL